MVSARREEYTDMTRYMEELNSQVYRLIDFFGVHTVRHESVFIGCQTVVGTLPTCVGSTLCACEKLVLTFWGEHALPEALEQTTTVLPANKIIENGQVYILRAGTKYTLFGVPMPNNNSNNSIKQ